MENQPACGIPSVEEVVDKYSDMVYRLAYSMMKNTADADDVYQEVFLRYVSRKGSFADENHRKAWLLRVTINCSKKIYQSAWYQKTVRLEDESSRLSCEDLYELNDFLNSLPQKYRPVIHLFYYEDMSVNEISQVLKANPSTVRSWLSRARKILREQWKGEIIHE